MNKKVENIVKEAFDKNELPLLLKGVGEYRIETDKFLSIPTEVSADYTIIIPAIYHLYDNGNIEVKEVYERTLKEMCSGDIYDIYSVIAVLYFQTVREEAHRASFSINRNEIIASLDKWLKKNSDLLNEPTEISDEIKRYKRLFSAHYDIVI